MKTEFGFRVVLSTFLAVISGFISAPIYAQFLPSDFDQNCAVDQTDLAALLGAWGTKNSLYDLNRDGRVLSQDLAIFLGQWGPYTPTGGMELCAQEAPNPVVIGSVGPSPSNRLEQREILMSGEGITHYQAMVVKDEQCPMTFESEELTIEESYVLTLDQGDGIYAVCARGRNANGIFQEEVSRSEELLLDTRAPLVSFTHPISNDIGAASQVTFGGSCSELDQPVVMEGAFIDQTDCIDYSWNLTKAISSSVTEFVVSVRQLDMADNLGRSESRRFVRAASGPFANQRFIAVPPQSTAEFGGSVATDGVTIVVGSPRASAPNGYRQGLVSVFEKQGSSPYFRHDLVVPYNEHGARLGNSVAISGDRIIAGAWNWGTPDLNVFQGQGAALIYKRPSLGSAFQLEALLRPSQMQTDGRFGYSVAMEGDVAVVGAHLEDQGSTQNAGAIYVFRRNTSNQWIQEARLTAPTQYIYRDAFFGQAVAISGNTIAVGAFGDDSFGDGAGAVYVFTQSGTLPWSFQARLKSNDIAAFDNFGIGVDIEGNRIVASAYTADLPGKINAGAAYVFSRTGTTWTQEAKLIAQDADANDWFGNSVTIQADRVVVGDQRKTIGSSANAGAAYVFKRTGSSWSQIRKLTVPGAAGADYWGSSVSLFGANAILGGQLVDVSGLTNAGAAYVFGDIPQ